MVVRAVSTVGLRWTCTRLPAGQRRCRVGARSTASAHPARGWPEMKRDTHRILLLICVSVPSFMINLDANIVAVSLSSIARSLNADFADVEWVVSAYTLTFASCLMPAGALADRYGRKRMLIAGLAIFTLASWLCGAARSALLLDAARALQGVGAALQLSAALAILSHAFRGPDRSRAFAFWGSVIGIAAALGPVIGGLITRWLGWEWAFYVNVPVGVLLIGLVALVLEESRDPGARRLDLPGSVSFSGALLLTTLALITGNRRGWEDALVLGELAGGIALFAVFLLVEKMQARPMVDLTFFRRRTYLGANLAGLTFAATFLTMLLYLPIYLQAGLGHDPQAAGLLMLPMAIPLFIVPRLVSRHLVTRYSGRALLTLGLALVAFGFAWLSLAATAFRYFDALGGMLVAGIGAGILNGETAKVGMTVIPPERAGMASGVGGTVRFTGIVLGFSLLGTALFGRIVASLRAQVPDLSEVALRDLARQVASGGLPPPGQAFHDAALLAYGHGYGVAAALAAIAAALGSLGTWLLVSPDETAPMAAAGASEPFMVQD